MRHSLVVLIGLLSSGVAATAHERYYPQQESHYSQYAADDAECEPQYRLGSGAYLNCRENLRLERRGVPGFRRYDF